MAGAAAAVTARCWCTLLAHMVLLLLPLTDANVATCSRLIMTTPSFHLCHVLLLAATAAGCECCFSCYYLLLPLSAATCFCCLLRLLLLLTVMDCEHCYCYCQLLLPPRAADVASTVDCSRCYLLPLVLLLLLMVSLLLLPPNVVAAAAAAAFCC